MRRSLMAVQLVFVMVLLLSGCASVPLDPSGHRHDAQERRKRAVAVPSPAEPRGGATGGGPASSAETPRSDALGIRTADTMPGIGGSEFNVWRSIGAIVFVLGGLLAATGLLKRRQSMLPGRDGTRHIKLVERMALGPRRGLLLVEVDGQSILLGTTGENLEPMAVLGSGSAAGAECEKNQVEQGVEAG